MVTISSTLRDTIERRSRRAWRRRASGSSGKNHRISGVMDDELQYRVPYSPGYYGTEEVKVVLKDDGSVVVDPPTTGLIDVLIKDDIKRLKKHAGEIRAYMLIKDGTDYQFTTYVQESEPLKSRAQCVDDIKSGDRVYVVEADYDDLTLASYDTGDFTAREYTVVSELDPEKDLGFTTGLLDLRTKDDVVALRNKKHLGRIRAYKYTTKEGESPIQTPKIKYEVGKDYEVKDADTDPLSNCHKGINVAHADWCKGNTRVFAFEFEMEDIAVIPTNTDGKFRLHRCKCVEEIDPKTLKPLEPKEPKKPGFFGKLLGMKDEDEDEDDS